MRTSLPQTRQRSTNTDSSPLHSTLLQSPPRLPSNTVINSLQLETNWVCLVSKELTTKVQSVLLGLEKSSSRLSLAERLQGAPLVPNIFYVYLTLILRRSRTGTVCFYTSTSNKRAARPKLYTKSLTGDLKLMYSRLTLVRISIKL